MTHPYASEKYARAFGLQYKPLYLEEAKTHVLTRAIPGTPHRDAMGCYPLMPIEPHADLEVDFEKMRGLGLVSFVGVTDPFYAPSQERLAKAFDNAIPYKKHFICDFSKELRYSAHHRYEIKRAQKQCDIRLVALSDYLGEWCALYALLIERHSISGIQAFGRDYFEALSPLNPVMVGAFFEEKLVSAHLWFSHEGHVYSHLAASNEEGYRLRAPYGVYAAGIDHFHYMGAKLLDLGAGAGIDNVLQGLAFFKQGFSNDTRPCFLCSKILDTPVYDALSVDTSTTFFPAYRSQL